SRPATNQFSAGVCIRRLRIEGRCIGQEQSPLSRRAWVFATAQDLRCAGGSNFESVVACGSVVDQGGIQEENL
ncbi:MAG: hypothetical protein WAM53_20080, partial [Terrimicrobiaceae bacterium]